MGNPKELDQRKQRAKPEKLEKLEKVRLTKVKARLKKAKLKLKVRKPKSQVLSALHQQRAANHRHQQRPQIQPLLLQTKNQLPPKNLLVKLLKKREMVKGVAW